MPNESEGVLVSIGIDPASVVKLIEEARKAGEEASAAAKIEVEVDGEQASIALSSALTAAGQAAEQLEVKLSAVAQTLVGLLGRASALAAEDEVALVRLNNTYGTLAAGAEKFAAALAKQNLALGEGDIQEALATFGKIGQAVGQSNAESLEFSKTIVQLASDLSKTSGRDFNTVLEALRASLLRGGNAAAEFGIKLTEADIKQKAAALGLAGLVEAGNAEAQTQVRLALVTERAAGAHQEAAGAATNFAQAQAELKKQTDEAFGALGQQVNQALLPLIQKLAQAAIGVSEFIQAHTSLGKVALGITGAIVALGVALSGLAIAVAAVALKTQLAVVGTGLMAGAFKIATFATLTLAKGLALASNGFSLLIGSFLGKLVIAAGLGAALGTLIDRALGISEAFAKSAAATEHTRIQFERFQKAGVTVADTTLVTAAALQQFADKANLSAKGLQQARRDANIYGAELRKLGEATGQGAKFTDDLNRFVGEGQSPFKARAQALSADVRLQHLHELGTARNAAQQKEYEAAIEGASEATKTATGITDTSTEALERNAEATKALTKTREDAAKGATDAELDLAEARAAATETLEDDITALIKRNKTLLEEQDPEARAQNRLQVDSRITALREANERKIAEKEKENIKKNLEERKEALKSATDAALSTEDAILKARADATDSLQDDIAHEKRLADRRLKNAKSEEERQVVRRDLTLTIQKIEEDASRKREALAKSAGEAAKSAENSLADARVQATEALADDIKLMNERRDAEIALAKSEAERAAIKRRFIAEETKLIEDANRTRKKARQEEDKATKKSLAEFAEAQSRALARKQGKGAVVDAKEFGDNLKNQAKNVKDEKDLALFKKAGDDAATKSALERRDAEIEAANRVAQAQADLNTAKRSRDPAERAAARDALEQAIADQVKLQRQNQAAIAEEEKQRGQAEAAAKQNIADTAALRKKQDADLAAAEAETNKKTAAELERERLDADAQQKELIAQEAVARLEAAKKAGREVRLSEIFEAQQAIAAAEKAREIAKEAATAGVDTQPVLTEVEKQTEALATFGAMGTDTLTNMATAVVTAIENMAAQVIAAVLNLQTAVGPAAAAAATVTALPDVTAAGERLDLAQGGFVETLSAFGETVVSKFEQAAARFDELSANIGALTARLDEVALAPDAEDVAAAQALGEA